MKCSLTARQRKFIEAYSGNATEAARLAGYTGSENALAVMGNKLLRNANILKAIKEREKVELKSFIASRTDRQKFWTDTMNNTEIEIRERLKASELLGKSEADFKEKIEFNTTCGLAERLKAARERLKTSLN